MFEIRLPAVPALVNSVIAADPWKLAGQAVVVDQVGWSVREPEAELSTKLPGCEPTAATAIPAVSRPAPAVIPQIPRRKIARRVVLAVRHLAIASRSAPDMI
jgi:hypothetical protein